MNPHMRPYVNSNKECTVHSSEVGLSLVDFDVLHLPHTSYLVQSFSSVNIDRFNCKIEPRKDLILARQSFPSMRAGSYSYLFVVDSISRWRVPS